MDPETSLYCEITILEEKVEKLLDLIEELIKQECNIHYEDGVIYDSMGISVYARAMAILSDENRFKIERKRKNKITGCFLKRDL